VSLTGHLGDHANQQSEKAPARDSALCLERSLRAERLVDLGLP
jgi:hypothetical protein